MMNRSLVGFAVIALLSGSGALAHEGHTHKVMGTVAALHEAHIEVDTKDGKKESFVLTKDTKYLKGKQAALASDVELGARVVLSVIEKEGKKTVTEVEMSANKPAPAAPKPR